MLAEWQAVVCIVVALLCRLCPDTDCALHQPCPSTPHMYNGKLGMHDQAIFDTVIISLSLLWVENHWIEGNIKKPLTAEKRQPIAQ